MFGMSYQQPIISSIRLENLEVSAQQAADDSAQIKIDVQGLHDLTLQYRNDAQFYFEQVQQFQAGDFVTTSTFNDALSAFSFSDLASVPSEYNPSAHRHSWSELDDVPLTFAPSAHRHDWSDLDNVPVEFEPAEHVHTWQQISGKPATFPPEIHVHDWSEIQNKPAAFMPVAHQHSWADITGKPSTYTPSAHTHEWNDIQNKPNVFHTGNSVNPLNYGLGVNAATVPILENVNLNNVFDMGFYFVKKGANSPIDVSDYGYLFNRVGDNSGHAVQEYRPYNDAKRVFHRFSVSGNWHDWVEGCHSGNFDWFQNVSGNTVGSGGLIAGADLNPAQSGTWRNVGEAVTNGTSSLFMRY